MLAMSAPLAFGQWDWRSELPGFNAYDNDTRRTSKERVSERKRFRERTTDEWWRILRAAGVWAGPVNRVQDLASDPNVLANEYLVTFPDGFVGPPAPFEVDGWRGSRGLAADYGQHTDEVLQELGYGDEDLLELRVEKAIW